MNNLGTNGGFGLHGEQLFVFEVDESRDGEDLNGDGDDLDQFYRASDLMSGRLTDMDVRNTGAPGSQELVVDGRRVAFRSFEDGGLYLFDADTGLVDGLGIEGFVEALAGDLLLYSAKESGGDLNGDGDLLDSVLHALVLSTGTPINLGLALGFPSVVLSDGETLVVGVWEAGQSHEDLNGDGDDGDSVAHLFIGPFQAPTNLDLVIRGPDILGHEEFFLSPFLERGALVFTVAEGSQGMSDLNGDGDAFDNVLHVVDVASGSTLNLALAVADLQIQDGLVAISVREDLQGDADLNGDGDASDTVLLVHELGADSVQNLSSAVAKFSIEGRSILFTVPEDRQAGTDLNGDGDAFDRVLHAFEPATGTLTNTGFALEDGRGHRLDDSLFLFVSEASQGALDLDGDGDSDDFVLHQFDLGTGAVMNLGLQGFASSDGSLLAFRVDEVAMDSNGDGDVLDSVWYALGPGCSELTNLGLAGSDLGYDGFSLGFTRGMLALRVSEAAQGGTDLNGDGDALDSILHVVDLDPN